MPDTPAWLIVLWLCAVGGAVGSFLNVVVYRLPLGISLIRPSSHCPKCGRPIRWFDNVPVFGWLALRGRCRDCRAPISARYPVVEAITAGMFGLLGAVELPHLCELRFYQLYPYELLLLCTLLCAGLIEHDGNRPPWKLFAPALVVGALAPLMWPELRALPAARMLPTWGEMPAPVAGTVDGLAGLVAGALLGGIAWRTLHDEKPQGLTLGLVCVGLSLGWQVVAVIAFGTAWLIAPLWLPERVAPRARIPGSMLLGAVTLGWLLIAGRILLAARLVSL
jgi:hypothetical protein